MHFKAFRPFLLPGIFFLCAVIFQEDVFGQSIPQNVWEKINLPQNRPAADRWIAPQKSNAVKLNHTGLRNLLSRAPKEIAVKNITEGAEILLPMPDGTLARFHVVDSPVMAPELAAKFPEIKTYLGQGMDDRFATVRFDVTPSGLHAQILSPKGAVYIEPAFKGDAILHVSFFKRDFRKAADGFQCLVPGNEAVGQNFSRAEALGSGGTLRTYRLACAATGEYTQFHGGTVSAGMSAIVTAVNRVTGIYESELALRLVLVANNNLLVFTNGSTDPFTNNDGTKMLAENQTTIDNIIGSANYDIGHVFSTGGGGIAGVGIVCVNGSKARGVTGSSAPVGDAFYIDYVAHEMGHQFGGNHTFNSVALNCGGGTRNAATAFEPGSGSTIMAYAGICGADDLQAHSDPYFHSISFDEINSNITSGNSSSCPVKSVTGNTVPAVSAGANYVIPKGTPFTLTATGNDPDADALSFCWEERDLGSSQALADPDNGSSPIFRSFNPSFDAVRTFPKISSLLNNSSSLGEKLPATTRTMKFRVTARDNRPGGGGVNASDMQVSVVGSAGPFLVTSPNSAVVWSGSQTVTWNVAGSSVSPINASNVNILLSTNGGQTFPIFLKTNTPNDGAELVFLPNIFNSQARVKIEAAGNIFFTISGVDFTITNSTPAPLVVMDSASLVSENCGNGNNAIDPGETVSVKFALANIGSASTTNLTATLMQTTGVNPMSGPQNYGVLTAGGAPVEKTYSFVADGICGGTLPVILEIRDNDVLLGTLTNIFRLGSFVERSLAFTNSTQIKVPGSGTSGAASPYPSTISVSGAPGKISKVVLTLAGLTHTAPADIDVLLVGPAGQAAIVLSDVGGNSGVSGITIKLDDFAPVPLPNSTLTSGTFQPTNIGAGDTFPAPAPQGTFGSALSIFNGTTANGVWSLYVQDDASQNKGSIGGWGLEITTAEPNCCTGNKSPILAAIPDRTIDELTTLVFTNSATDSDSTAIYFSLGTNAPTGATIDASSGVFFWTPSEEQGPGIYNVTVIATDNGSPALSDAKTFQVTVNEVNSPPQLTPVANRIVHAGTTLALTNSASDSDFPPNALAFSFNGTVPAGATMDSKTGVFIWTPLDSQIGTNAFSIQVSDDGIPSLTASQQFVVIVQGKPSFSIQRTGNFATLQWTAISGANYRVEFKHDLSETVWNALTNKVSSGTIASVEIPISSTNTFYRIEVLAE